MSANTTDFARLVSVFLTDYLPLQRNYSKNTILSYRDALKLLVVFITDEKGIRLTEFTMKAFNRQLPIKVTKEADLQSIAVKASRPTMSNAYDEDYFGTLTVTAKDTNGNDITVDWSSELLEPEKNAGVIIDKLKDTEFDAEGKCEGFVVDGGYYEAYGAPAKTYTIKVSATANDGKVKEARASIQVKALADAAWNVSGSAGAKMEYAVEFSDGTTLDEGGAVDATVARLAAYTGKNFAGYVRVEDGEVVIGSGADGSAAVAGKVADAALAVNDTSYVKFEGRKAGAFLNGVTFNSVASVITASAAKAAIKAPTGGAYVTFTTAATDSAADMNGVKFAVDKTAANTVAAVGCVTTLSGRTCTIEVPANSKAAKLNGKMIELVNNDTDSNASTSTAEKITLKLKSSEKINDDNTPAELDDDAVFEHVDASAIDSTLKDLTITVAKGTFNATGTAYESPVLAGASSVVNEVPRDVTVATTRGRQKTITLKVRPEDNAAAVAKLYADKAADADDDSVLKNFSVENYTATTVPSNGAVEFTDTVALGVASHTGVVEDPEGTLTIFYGENASASKIAEIFNKASKADFEAADTNEEVSYVGWFTATAATGKIPAKLGKEDAQNVSANGVTAEKTIGGSGSAVADGDTQIYDLRSGVKFGTKYSKYGLLTNQSAGNWWVSSKDDLAWGQASIAIRSINYGEDLTYTVGKPDQDVSFAKPGNYSVVFTFKLVKDDKAKEAASTVTVKNSLTAPVVTVSKRKVDGTDPTSIKDALKINVDMNNNSSEAASFNNTMLNAKFQTAEANNGKITVAYVGVDEGAVTFLVPVNATFTTE